MIRPRTSVVAGSAVLTLLGVVAIRAGVVPAGVPGEWQWPLQAFAPDVLDLFIAALAVIGFAVFAALGLRALEDRPSIFRERLWVSCLVAASVAAQVAVQSGGPVGHGMAKWSSLGMHGASGYFGVARSEMADPWTFWAEYPGWIKHQGVLHIGTHPPGLMLVAKGLMTLTAGSPALTSFASKLVPAPAGRAIETFLAGDRWTKPQRAAVILMGWLTLLMSAGTVVPLYRLARSSLPPAGAWASACLWPIAPAVLMFQPTADTAFPFLATWALFLASEGGRTRAALAGVILAVGMQFSLVFLPVGLTVALIQGMRRELRVVGRLGLVLGTGAGFLLLTFAVWWVSKANPFAIWWSNQANHGLFYRDHPRGYLAWVAVNPIEMLFAVGIPTVGLAFLGMSGRRRPPAAVAGLIVLLLMNFSGKNLSEVARLWIPLMPPIALAAGSTFSDGPGGPRTLAVVLIVLGVQALSLQATLQVIFPV